MKEYRKRKKAGLFVLRVTIGPWTIKSMVKRGHLAEADSSDRNAITKAFHDLMRAARWD